MKELETRGMDNFRARVGRRLKTHGETRRRGAAGPGAWVPGCRGAGVPRCLAGALKWGFSVRFLRWILDSTLSSRNELSLSSCSHVSIMARLSWLLLDFD